MATSDLERALNYIADLLRLFINRQQRRAVEPAFSQPYGVIDPPLFAGRRNAQSSFFSFGVPAGWRDMSAEECYRMSGLTRTTVLAGVTTEQTDPFTTNFIAGATSPNDNEEDFLHILAAPDRTLDVRVRALGGRALSRPTRVLVDQRRGLLLAISALAPGQLYGQQGEVPVVQSEVHVARGREQFVLMFNGPAYLHSDLLPAFWTMLGTWQWS
jgi:hypothetical protein